MSSSVSISEVSEYGELTSTGFRRFVVEKRHDSLPIRYDIKSQFLGNVNGRSIDGLKATTRPIMQQQRHELVFSGIAAGLLLGMPIGNDQI